MRIHIAEKNEKVTEIAFSERNSDYLEESKIDGVIRICDEDGCGSSIQMCDVPNLIKALKKALEIWS